MHPGCCGDLDAHTELEPRLWEMHLEGGKKAHIVASLEAFGAHECVFLVQLMQGQIVSCCTSICVLCARANLIDILPDAFRHADLRRDCLHTRPT